MDLTTELTWHGPLAWNTYIWLAKKKKKIRCGRTARVALVRATMQTN